MRARCGGLRREGWSRAAATQVLRLAPKATLRALLTHARPRRRTKRCDRALCDGGGRELTSGFAKFYVTLIGGICLASWGSRTTLRGPRMKRILIGLAFAASMAGCAISTQQEVQMGTE